MPALQEKPRPSTHKQKLVTPKKLRHNPKNFRAHTGHPLNPFVKACPACLAEYYERYPNAGNWIKADMSPNGCLRFD